MIKLRKSAERGSFDHGWLKTFHSFSFADYYDPSFMGFRSLRVINEDFVQAGEGFGTHGHRDMEIITYVLEGELAHKDSMGNGSAILPGEVQYMSAGRGVTHSEFNHSKDHEVHLMQIWIMPNKNGLEPRYDQKKFADSEKQGKLKLLVSGGTEPGVIQIRQDVKLFASILAKSDQVGYALPEKRFGYVLMVRGGMELNGNRLAKGDAASIVDESDLSFRGLEDGSEFLFFDLS